MYLRLRKSALIKVGKLRSKDSRILRTQLLWRWSHRSHGLMSCSETKWKQKNASEFKHLKMLKKSSSSLRFTLKLPGTQKLHASCSASAHRSSCTCSTFLYAHLHGFLSHSLYLSWHYWFFLVSSKRNHHQRWHGTESLGNGLYKAIHQSTIEPWEIQPMKRAIFSGYTYIYIYMYIICI